ncbi:DNA polymerase III subunit gamma and tau, partial [Streptomyces sp. NPDC001274]
FEVVDRVIEGGNDPRRFVADLLERLRDLVILAAVPDAGEKGLIDAPADVVERMQAQASVFGAAELSRAADLVNTGLTEMRGATSPRLQVELICARVLLPAAFDDERSLQARLDRLERGASFATTGPGPAMGYVPGPEALAHAPVPAAPAVAPGGGPAAARAAVRGDASAPVQAPPPAAAAPPAPPVHETPAAPPAAAPASAPAGGQRPGAWPTAAAPESGRRPGGWPTASAPGQSQPPRAAAPTPTAPASAPQAPGAAEPSAGMAQGAAQVRNMWPDVLEAVKNRRRFTWILLSQNAQVTGFDGSTLQIGFLNAGARDTFASSGSEDVLRQALAERFNAQWKIETVIDPSGGGGAPPQGGGGRPHTAAPPYQPPAPQQSYEPRPAAPAEPEPSRPQPSPRPAQQSQAGGAPAPEPAPPAYAAPPHAVAPEDDIPEADDPDLVDSALSGHELIVRELGATVIEEFTNE